MQQHAEQLGQEMTRLLHELEQSGFAWRALLFAPLQHWQFWTVAGVLLLLFGLCWWLRRRSYEPDRRRAEQSCSSNTQEEVEVHEVDSEDALGRSFAKRIPWPVQNLAYRSRVMEELAGDLLRVFHMYFSGSFFPVLQPVIGVGSTFEGWSPREEDARYRLLLPLQPPRGHAFRLELGTAGEMPAKDCRVRVALECICRRPELVDDTLCFLHHPEEELRENQAPSLLHTLCTGSYLDAQKTARWFEDTVRSAWGVVPLSRLYKMNLLPSSRSCKMQLISTSGRSLFAEIIFGVQLGVSDIFLSSQPAEPGLIPSTRWPQSCVVAEAKFFRVMARQAPRDSFHLKCLQICARILEGTAFSTYTFKTAVMHLLTTTPLSDWRRRHFMLRLEDIMRYLDDCLKEKRLNHFFFGNEHVPEEIILPPAFPTAEPPNLFQHLAQDPAAHARAMTEFDELQNRLTSLLFYGLGIICHPPQLCTLPVCRRAPEASSLGTIRKPSPSARAQRRLLPHVAPDPAAHAEALHDIVQLRQLHTTGKESGDYGGHKGDFHAAFSSHCHDGGGELRGAEKLPGRSGWAGTKREALRMCLPVLSGAPVENLPLPDAPQGVTAARRDMLDTEKTVLCRHTAGTEILPCRGPILPPGYTPSPTRRSHEGTKSTNASSEVSTKGADPISQDGISKRKAPTGHVTQSGSGFAWRALLFAPLQHWQFWTVAGVLLLLFGLCWWLRRRSYEPDRRRAEQSCSSNTQEEVEVHEVDSEDALGRSFAKRIPWPVQNLAYRSRVMEELAGDLLRVFHMYFSGSFFPVLQPVIRVGSTFEGWSPREEDARYRLLLPLQPPRGHAFRLELGTAGEMPAKDSRVRVALECICRRPELVDDTLCFLHHPEEELRENQAPSLLHTLCTGSYLDAQKTARWFQDTVRSAWGVVPLSRLYKMNLLPSSRSCKMQLISTSGRSLFAEIIFGVQLGVSDIFLSSQPAEPGLIPSTRWPQSCVVAEAKFFRVVARQAPRDSFHLKCLQICARILEGTAFSTYTFKTAVMHLLTTTPLSDWRRRHFMLRLEDIMRYLDDCLKEKRLNHFFFGNEHVPEEIILPPAFPTAEPPNLFQHLAQDPAAHARAMTEFDELQNRLTSLLFYGR
ncbi:uncharacterized protein O9250_015558 [Rhynochetos jubatus]